MFDGELRIGEEWVFAPTVKTPVRMADITHLCIVEAPSLLSADMKKLEASLAADEVPCVLCKFSESELPEYELGILCALVRKANPDLILEQPLDAMLTKYAKVAAEREASLIKNSPRVVCPHCHTEQSSGLFRCRFCLNAMRTVGGSDISPGDSPMTKEQYETLMLNDYMTIEDYEREYLAGDVFRFYDLRSCVDLLSVNLHKTTIQTLLNWEAYHTVRKGVDAVKRAMHDENVQFNFFNHVTNEQLDFVRSSFEDEKQASRLIGSARRLMMYQACKSISAQEILALSDERDFARKLEAGDPPRFKAWCETHPGVDIHADNDADENQAGD